MMFKIIDIYGYVIFYKSSNSLYSRLEKCILKETMKKHFSEKINLFKFIKFSRINKFSHFPIDNIKNNSNN